MKFRFPEVFLGILLAVAIFAIGAAFSSQHAPKENAVSNSGPAGDLLFGYPALDLFTALLALATIGLGAISIFGIRSQWLDTRTIQRAYVSADPLGIGPFDRVVTPGTKTNAHVGFRNTGNLPAKNVEWFIDVAFDSDVHRSRFLIGGHIGDNIVPPGTVMRQWHQFGITQEDFATFAGGEPWAFAFVWGEVRYDDGFGGTKRSTRFCHRYERTGLQPVDDRNVKIVPDDGGAVYHQHGNNAN